MDVAYPLYFSVSGNDAFVLGTGVVPRRRRCELGHHPESNGVVVAPVKGAALVRSTQRRCVEPVIRQAVLGKAVGDRGVDQSTEAVRQKPTSSNKITRTFGAPQAAEAARWVDTTYPGPFASNVVSPGFGISGMGKNRPRCTCRCQRMSPFDRCFVAGLSCWILLFECCSCAWVVNFAFAGARIRD